MDGNQQILPVDKKAMKIPADGSSPHLIAGRCSNCGSYFFPKKELCPSCFDQGQVEEVPLNGQGKLLSYTVVRRGLGSKRLPYGLGYIQVPWNLIVFAQLTDCDLDHLAIGMNMEVVFEEEEEEGRKILIYKFRPMKEK